MAQLAVEFPTGWPVADLIGAQGTVVYAGTTNAAPISEDQDGATPIPGGVLEVTVQNMVPGFWLQGDPTDELEFLSGTYRCPLVSLAGVAETASWAWSEAEQARIAANASAQAAEDAAEAAERPTDEAVDHVLSTEGTQSRQRIDSLISEGIPAEVERVVSEDEEVREAAAALAQSDVGLVRKEDVTDEGAANWDDAVYGFVFQDDKASFLEVRGDGDPTDYSTDRIGTRLDQRGWLSGGGGPSGGLRTAISLETTPAGSRDYPLAVKPLEAPILPFANNAATSVLWPRFVVDDTGALVGVINSTDHGNHGASGIFFADLAHPLEQASNSRLIFRDDAGGNQCETGDIWYEPSEGLYHMTYQMQNNSNNGGIPEQPDPMNAQLTLEATAENIEGPWTRLGPITNSTIAYYGVNHSGYANTFPYRGGRYMWTLASAGGGMGLSMLWQRHQGTWYRRPVLIGRDTIRLDHLDGWTPEWLAVPQRSSVFEWRGRPWIVTTAGTTATAGTVGVRRVIAVPMAEDLSKPVGLAVDITPPEQDWEEGGVAQIGGSVTVQGRTFVLYLGANPDREQSIGVMELI